MKIIPYIGTCNGIFFCLPTIAIDTDNWQNETSFKDKSWSICLAFLVWQVGIQVGRSN